jgi:hypothetical protein
MPYSMLIQEELCIGAAEGATLSVTDRVIEGSAERAAEDEALGAMLDSTD